MKQKRLYTFLITLLLAISLAGMVSFRLFAKLDFYKGSTTPPNHELWDALLKDFAVDGHVDYQRLHANTEQLNIYLHRLQGHPPSAGWSNDEILAYWINAYNAFTLKIILDNYPVKSIKDIGDKLQFPLVNSTWDIQFIAIGDKTLSLNDIEHRILRQEFDEPRIHFAIVCASKSCPPLRNEAYFPAQVDKQLNEQALAFVNDNSKNQIAKDHIEISQLFDWFKGDFTKKGSLIDFLNKYSHTHIDAKAKISYLDYDWTPNDCK